MYVSHRLYKRHQTAHMGVWATTPPKAANTRGPLRLSRCWSGSSVAHTVLEWSWKEFCQRDFLCCFLRQWCKLRCCNAQKSQHFQQVPYLPPPAPQPAGTAELLHGHPARTHGSDTRHSLESSTKAWLISLERLCKTLKRFLLSHVKQT